MRSITPKAVASSAITVTNTARLLYSLMDTAGSTSQSLNHFTDQGANTVVICPENGDVRFLFNGAPTAALGTLLKEGTTATLVGVDLSAMKLIRTGGSNVTCSVQIFAAQAGESGWGFGAAAGSGAGVYSEDTAHTAGNEGVMILTKRTDTAAASAGTDGNYQTLNTDALGNVWVHEYYAPEAEDNAIGVVKVEKRYSTSGALTTDTQVKASAGFVHTVTISQNDAAPTAGTIDIYDNTAGSGTKIFTWTLTTAVFTPFTVTLDVSCANGIYVDFTTTADVAVFVSYR